MLTGEVRTYGFNKIAGQWKMTRIEDNPLSKYGDCAFIDFYQQFATDSAFQMAHVKPMLSILMESPEDEFEKIDGVIEAEQWPSFCPELPADVFTNIDYGQSMSLGNRSCSRRNIERLYKYALLCERGWRMDVATF